MLIKQNESIYSKKINGHWILLEKNKKYTQELNDTAGFIWELCNQPIETTDIAKKICTEFNINNEKAKKDIKKIINVYLKKDFLIKIN